MYFKGNKWSLKTFTYIGANNSFQQAVFWLKLLPCQCVHLSSGHTTPITWIPVPSYFCWAMRWQHLWISPSPCPCGSWLARISRSDRRSVVIPLQQAEVIVLYNTDTDHINKTVQVTSTLLYMNMQSLFCGLFYLQSWMADSRSSDLSIVDTIMI